MDYVPFSSGRVGCTNLPIGLSAQSRLHGVTNRRRTAQLLTALEPPSGNQIDHWTNVLNHSVVATGRDLRRHQVRTRHPKDAKRLLRDLNASWKYISATSNSWASFASHMNADILCRLIPQNIAFVSGTALYVRAADSHQTVINQLQKIGLLRSTDWWLTCPACGSRLRCLWTLDSGSVIAECGACARTYREEVRFGDTWENGQLKLLPRVEADVSLETVWLRSEANGSYGGSLGHLMQTRKRLAENGILSPPELVWDPLGLVRYDNGKLPEGTGARLVARGGAPLVIYYLLFDEETLRDRLISGSRPGPYGNQEALAILRVPN